MMSYVVTWTTDWGARSDRVYWTLDEAVREAGLIFRDGAREVSVWGGNGTDECPSTCFHRVEASFQPLDRLDDRGG